MDGRYETKRTRSRNAKRRSKQWRLNSIMALVLALVLVLGLISSTMAQETPIDPINTDGELEQKEDAPPVTEAPEQPKPPAQDDPELGSGVETGNGQTEILTVRFLDYQSHVIGSEQSIQKGGRATPPNAADIAAPEGQQFAGWDTDAWQNVQASVDVQAIYTEAEQQTDDAPDAAAGMNDIVVVPSSTNQNSLQTFTSLADNTTPDKLHLALAVSKVADVSGGRIELPLDYIPSMQGLTDFTMDENMFILQTPDEPTESSIVESYEVVSDPSKLVIHLKDGTAAGQETINLYFDLNPAYDSKIPTKTTMWKVNVKGYVDTKEVYSATPLEITSGAVTTAPRLNSTSKFIPANENYVSGAVTVRTYITNRDYYQNDFDPSYNNRYYIEVPTGSVVGSAWLNQYNSGTEELDDGYTRYYRNISSPTSKDSGDWSHWDYVGTVGHVFLMRDGEFTPPEMEIGTDFEFRIGIDYKKYNGKIDTISRVLKYTKTDMPAWDLHMKYTHTTGSGTSIPVCPTVDGGTANRSMSAVGVSSYPNSSTSKNMGAESITGVQWRLTQPTDGSEKLNYDRINVNTSIDIADESNLPGVSIYSVEYTIKNALTSETRQESGGSSSGQTNSSGRGTFSATLPTLGDNEYIDQVIVTPMGVDGTSNGEWPSRNGLGISYRAKAWNGQVWPDGTDVPGFSAVRMGWNATYNDEEGSPQTLVGTSANTYYAESNATAAYANLVSSNAVGKVPGDTVGYEIQGYNSTTNAITGWENPTVAVRVPKALELTDLDDKVLTDEATGASYTVVPRLTKTDDNYNYYNFQAIDYTAPKAASIVFRIPVQFKVLEGTLPGTYAIENTLVSAASSTPFVQVYYKMNNLPAAESGADYGIAGNYSLVENLTSTSVTVVSGGKLSAGSAIKSAGTGDAWVSTDVAPAAHGETVQMKVTIKNHGNTNYSNIKVYDILPESGDVLGSSGLVEFVGASGGTIKYNTSIPATYGKHGDDNPNLQSMSMSGWTTDPTNAKAILVDFGNTELKPGEEVDVVLSFKVPAEGEQVAYNQFRYSAKEDGTGTVLNLNSDPAGFSTESIMLNYKENLPAQAIDSAANMPAAVSGIFGLGGNKLTVGTEVPTLTGFSFKGWNTKADGTGTKYSAGGIYTFTKAGTVELFAQWDIKDVTIHLNQNYSGAPASTSFAVKFGASPTAAQLKAPKRMGYVFGGWNTSADGTGATYTTATVVHKDGPITLFAQWDKTPYTVNFMKNDGSNEEFTGFRLTDQTHGTKISSPTDPTRAGYIFDGWYTTAVEAANPVVGTKWDFATDTLQDETTALYAGWRTYDYTVTFDDDGATTAVSPATKTVASPATTVGTLPTEPGKTGYTFGGWWTEEDGNGTQFDAATAITEDTTVYAYWTDYSYTVTFDVQGASSPTDNFDLHVASPATTLGTLPSEPIKTGYLFGGWYTDENGGGTEFKGDTTVSGDLTVYANWDSYEYTVTYNMNDDTTDVHDTKAVKSPATTVGSLPVQPTRYGYTFDGWYDTSAATGGIEFTASTVVKASIDVYARWVIRDDYTVSFMKNDGSGDEFEAFKLDGQVYNTTIQQPQPDPVRNGYTFDGWYTTAVAADNPVSGTKWDFATDTLQDEATALYAGWRTHSYTVTFDDRGATTAVNPATKTVASPHITVENLPTAPRKTANSFGGWWTEKGGKGTQFDATTVVTEDTTVYAYWINLSYSHKVTFDVQGASSPTDNFDKYVAWPYTTIDALPADPVKTGYLFGGWYTGKDGSGTEFDATTIVNSDTTVYAKWDSYEYAVTYNMNDDTAAVYDTKIVKSPSTTVGLLPFNPSRDGYDFVNWNTKMDGSGTEFKRSTIVTGDIEVYAQWEGKTYTVNFNGNGATKESVPTTMTVTRPQMTISALPAPPSKAGFTFDGWNTAKNGTGSIFNAKTQVDANITVYAQWNAQYYQLSFNLNGGDSVVPPTQSLKMGDKAQAVSNPTRSGYEFTGWTTKQNGDDAWSFVFSRMPAADVTLYAQWTLAAAPTSPDPGPGTTPGDPGTGTGPGTDTGTGPGADPGTGTGTGTGEDIGAQASTETTVPDSDQTGARDVDTADTDPKTADIGDAQVPLFGDTSSNTWSLMNLILVVVGLVIAAVRAISVLVKPSDRKYASNNRLDGTSERTFRPLALAITAMAGIAMILVLALTQDFSATMALFDKWTALLAVILGIEIVAAALTKKPVDSHHDIDNDGMGAYSPSK